MTKTSRKGNDAPVKLPTPALAEGLALPPPDPITALRVMGENAELPLSPEKRTFTLGGKSEPEVDLSLPRTYVSDVHCFLQRKGNRLHIVDNDSTNGIFFNDRRDKSGEITAGESFRVADVRLLALDEHLRILRPYLQWSLGLTAHARVDDALLLIASGDPLLLLGEPGCDQLELARRIHQTTARRARAFVAVQPPLATEPERAAILSHASQGTAFLDLEALPTLTAPFVRELFGTTFHVRPIIAAREYQTAKKQLGEDQARALRHIIIPPLAQRRDDIPRLLDGLAIEANRPERVADLGAENVAALTKKKWPKNFDDLRFHAPRLRAWIEHRGNKSAAATAVGITVSSFSEWLDRLGLSDLPRRA